MTLHKHLLTAVIGLASTHVTFAQDSLRSSTLAVAIGVNYIAHKDAFESPYTYRGANALVNVIYKRTNPNVRHTVELRYSGGHTRSAVSPLADNKLLVFNYDYLLKVRPMTADRKFRPFFGVGLHALLDGTNYLPKVELPKNNYSAGAFIALAGDVTYHLSKRSSAEMRFRLPIFGVAYRPDFEINGKTLTKTTWIGQTNFLSASVEYDFTLSARLTLTASYGYSYFSFAEPRPITILQNGFSIGVRRIF